jgi:transcriptional regulator with XRE-family HTH domain
MNEEKKINENLRRARIEHGWTQKDLANALGVAEATVRSWELGKRFPGSALLVRLSSLLEFKM